MKRNIQNFEVNKSAKVITLGQLSKKTKFIWIAFHGYGQQADYMADKLSDLNEKDHFIICPEGLNKFYWHKNNEPVACWMTRDNRYAEISNFVAYLDHIYNIYCSHVHRDVRIILFGFSQGCATIWRWIHASQPKVDAILHWAGWIPEDISYLHLRDYLKDVRIILKYGTEDQFMNSSMISEMDSIIEKNELTIERHQFEGNHQIPRPILKQTIKELIKA